MSSAICFNLDQSKILSSGNGLRTCVYHLPYLNEEHLKNMVRKAENAANHHSILFQQCFPT